jgi:AcrR family transcriptional regulator
MVSQQKTSTTSRESILAAAMDVFQEVGFSGARVDEIAKRSNANKAMIYYHFGSKLGLYKTVLMSLFGDVLAEIQRLKESEMEPDEKLRALYRGIARHFEAKPALPPIMLREVLAGGEAMDVEASHTIGTILGFVAATIQEGVRGGIFRPVHPLVLHLSVLAPLMVHSAGTNFRERLLPREMPGLPGPTQADLLGHLLETLDRTLAPEDPRSKTTSVPKR